MLPQRFTVVGVSVRHLRDASAPVDFRTIEGEAELIFVASSFNSLKQVIYFENQYCGIQYWRVDLASRRVIVGVSKLNNSSSDTWDLLTDVEYTGELHPDALTWLEREKCVSV